MAKKSRARIRRGYVKPEHELGSRASYPALPLDQNAHRFYFCTVPVSDIFPFSFVSRREEDPQKGFQRNLTESRAYDIAKYLDSSVGSIPTNIVLSAQENANLEYNSKSKLLKYDRQPNAFLVLDGQHRLYGYGLTQEKHRVPVAIYEGLTRKQECALFIDINTNQRGVPAALLLDIKQVAERESEAEITLREFFDNLNRDVESPLNGLLSPSRSVTGKISRNTFNKSVRPIIDNIVMTKIAEDKQYILLRNYFSAIEQSLGSPGLLIRAAYFESFCDFFEDVMRTSRMKYNNYKHDSLVDVLSFLENIDLDRIPLKGGKTRVTKHDILPSLKAGISSQMSVDESMI